MSIFNKDISLSSLQGLAKHTLIDHLSITFTEIGENYIRARMPVDYRTHQPYGILHGGASVVLAETLGSVAATCCINTDKQTCVGIEINANHIKSISSGSVIGTTTPIHVGKQIQIWAVNITSEQGDLICTSRITLAVLDKKKA